MTLQEMFDMGVAGLAAQGFQQSIVSPAEEEELCVYRHPNGNKCAIGHCIPDDLYRPGMEEMKASQVCEKFSDVNDLFRGIDSDAMNDFQKCHDQGYSPGNMKHNLREFANAHDLVIPPVLQES